MSAHIEKLKERLASGEISMEEFVQMKALITDDSEDTNSPSAKIFGKVSGFVQDKMNKGQETNSTRIEISNKEFGTIIFEGDALVISGERRLLSSIASVNYGSGSFSFNFVPMEKATYVRVVFDDGSVFNISEDRVYTSFGAHGKLTKLYTQLAKATSQKRLNALAGRLRANGQILLSSDVQLMRDGTVSDGRSMVNLKKAATNGDIGIGMEWQSLGLSNGSNPNLISLSETKIKTRYSFGFGGNAGSAKPGIIQFIITHEDQDVAKSLLLWLSKDENFL